MDRQKRAFIDVDGLIEQIDLETVLRFYGVADSVELQRSGNEVRMRCLLNCGKESETGDRAISVRTGDPAKRWKCHQYECGKSGNLVGLIDLLKDGPNMGGRPRGERFKAIARDLEAMANCVASAAAEIVTADGQESPERRAEPPKVNLPLSRSEKVAARALVNLDEKLLRVPDENMNKHAAGYIRSRPYLNPELMGKWRMGYLPHDTGGDKSGGTMRGKIVYPMLSERGEVLTWFGRDPQYEVKRANWESSGRDPKREPRKHHFVKGFHRGLELFGQHARRLDEPGFREAIAEMGILLVEGPNDVIRLDALGVPAVGLCSNRITGDQVQRLAGWAKKLSGGLVTVMLDCDAEGERGSQQTVYELARHCNVHLAWLPTMFNGRFRGKQPESLDLEEWSAIRDALRRGGESS